MKRFHVHVAVDDLDQSVAFYSGLFGGAPSVRKSDYAKWMLEDPRVNFAISMRGREAGLDHLGFQVDSREELDAVQRQLDAAGLTSFAKGAASCCYAKSEKSWTRDPSGVAWETFFTSGSATNYGDDAATGLADARLAQDASAKAACCAPAPAAATTSGACCG